MSNSPYSSSERGAAPALAIFTVFAILIASAAATTYVLGYRRQAAGIHQRIAMDATKATLRAVEVELNDTLRTTVTAAMYEAGRRGEDREQVERRIRDYLNQRIAAGWSYANFSSIAVPSVDENSLRFEWLPGGGLRVYGYLGASFEHVMGARAYGIKLDVAPPPRFLRIENVARYVASVAGGARDLAALQAELNENYASEGLRIELWENADRIVVKVTDVYGAKGVILS